LEVLVQLNRGGKACVIHEVPTHIQVLGEGEHKALRIVDEVIELSVEVRAQQDLVAVPSLDSA
jgi:acid stress-induced BolA-like protein IbaG/YrbA